MIVDNRAGLEPLDRVYLGNTPVREDRRGFDGAGPRSCTDRLVLPGNYWLVLGGPPPDGRHSPNLFIEDSDLWTWNVRFDRVSCVYGGVIGGDC